jgi:CheY-like chemotaxis protein
MYIPESELPIHFDRSQFELAIINLASNARDAMPDGGACTFSAEQEGAHVILSIRDIGIGMSTSTKAQIFEPFFTTKPVGSGTGLGLSVVYGLIRNANGEMQVESELGKGSIFSIRLPIAAELIAPVLPVSEKFEECVRVLLIDDDDDLRHLLSSTLTRGGCEVIATGSGAETEKTVRRLSWIPQVIVCDYHLPDTDGIALLRALRQYFHAVPTILISTNIDSDKLHGEKTEPVVELLSKPFLPETLLTKVMAAARHEHVPSAAHPT